MSTWDFCDKHGGQSTTFCLICEAERAARDLLRQEGPLRPVWLVEQLRNDPYDNHRPNRWEPLCVCFSKEEAQQVVSAAGGVVESQVCWGLELGKPWRRLVAVPLIEGQREHDPERDQIVSD